MKKIYNRTNEKFLSGNPDDLNRVNLNELYANITLAKEYEKYINQKEYVDKLIKENDPKNQDEINYWKNILNKAKELRLDEHHYSEDFNKLNSEIAKYNYQIKQQNNQLLDVDYDKYLNLEIPNLETKKRLLIIYNVINKTNPVNNPNYLSTKSLLVG